MIRFWLRKKLLDCQRPRGKVKGKAQGTGKDLAIHTLAVINEPGEPSPAGKAHQLFSLAEPHQSPLRACQSVTPSLSYQYMDLSSRKPTLTNQRILLQGEYLLNPLTSKYFLRTSYYAENSRTVWYLATPHIHWQDRSRCPCLNLRKKKWKTKQTKTLCVVAEEVQQEVEGRTHGCWDPLPLCVCAPGQPSSHWCLPPSPHLPWPTVVLGQHLKCFFKLGTAVIS